ncbi:MAG: TonB-dependent receptor [Gammaproteobacteria bacterium]|nr:TonB-dependent receptor [Gammaproteobacteria bacterium]
MRRPLNGSILGLVVAALPSLVAVESAHAQQAALEEIVVTARRVEERLQTTPVAVSAFTTDMLEQLSATNVGDLAGFAPNLYKNTGPTGGNDGYYYIRGVGQFDLNPAVDPGVGTYLDGVYLGRIMGASFDTMDVARVEVLRGPQGTLYGRNTMGGAINVVTSDPGEVFGAKARITAGSRDRIDGQVSVDLPVNDQFKLKLSGLTRNQDGWGHRRSDGETFADTETLAGRIKALWEPTDNLAVRLSLDGTDSDGTPAHQILVGYQALPHPFLPVPSTPLGVPFPFPGTPFDFTPFVSKQNAGVDIYDHNSSVPAKANLDVWGVSGTIDWDVANLHVKSITSYRELEQFHPQDYDETPFAFFDGAFNTDQDQFSQELQLRSAFMDERVDWLLGVYYFKENVFHNNQVCLGGNNGLPPFAPGFAILTDRSACLQNNQRYDLDIETWAVFANVNFHVTDRITAIAGFRYTDETKKYAFDNFIDNTAGVFSFFGFPPIAFPTLSPDNPALTVSPFAEDSWDDWTPKFGLNYQVNDDMMLYFSYSEGFKSGGFNGRQSPNALTGLFDPLSSFDPETITTYEFGMKSEWLDRRVRLNVAGFLSTYENIQMLVVDPTSGFFNQINAAAADVDGFEVELLARPIEPLDLMANLGYADAGYTKLDPVLAFNGITTDDPLVNTPEWTMSYGAQYTLPLGGWGSFAVRGDYVYIDDLCYQAACNRLDLQDGYGIVNIRGTWTSPDERLSVSAFGLNVLDEEYYANSQDVISQGLGVAFAQPGRPAEWGLELSYRYGY